MSVITGTALDLPPGGIVPLPELTLAHMEDADGYQEQQNVGWVSLAAQWDRESGTYFDGQYMPDIGEVQSSPLFSGQDTFPTGTGGMSGRDFDVTGSPTTVVHPEYQNSGIFWPNSSAGGTFSALDHAVRTTNGLTHTHILIRRGLAPVGSTGKSQPRPFTYLRLAYGETTDYRIAIEWGQFIRLDYSPDGGATWQNGVSVLTDISYSEVYMAQNHQEIHFRIIPDTTTNTMKIQVGHQRLMLKHSPPRPANATDPNATTPLPKAERYQLTGQSGWCQFWVWSLDYSTPLTLTKSTRSVPDNLDLSNLQFKINALGRTEDSQTTQVVPYVDTQGKLGFQAQALNADTNRPATFTDIFFLIPSKWRDSSLRPYPANAIPTYVPQLQYCHEMSIFDEKSRMVSRKADVRINNWRRAFTGAYGEYAAIINNSNGLASAQRLRGMLAGGYTVHGDDMENVVDGTVWGNEYKLRQTLNQEILFDNWALPAAIHYTLDGAQIHPKFRQRIPFWPYGPVKASDGCPYPTLPRGTGNNPKFHFMPDATWIQVLLELAQDGLPTLGKRFLPWWTGTDPKGNWFFETYDTRALSNSVEFNDYDPTGYRRIIDITVSTNANDMRTALDFQGQDPFTGELLVLHVGLPQNVPVLGRNVNWFERAGRWCSPGYLATVAKSAAILCSLPTQTIAVKVPFDPYMQPGMLFMCSEQKKLGRTGFFVALAVEAMTGLLPDGKQACEMIVTGRSAESLTAY